MNTLAQDVEAKKMEVEHKLKHEASLSDHEINKLRDALSDSIDQHKVDENTIELMKQHQIRTGQEQQLAQTLAAKQESDKLRAELSSAKADVVTAQSQTGVVATFGTDTREIDALKVSLKRVE